MTKILALMLLGAGDYDAMRQRAIDTGKHLVVGIGVFPPDGDWFCCRVDVEPRIKTWHGFQSGTIIVSSPSGGELYYRISLPRSADAAEVSNILNPSRTIRPGPTPSSRGTPGEPKRFEQTSWRGGVAPVSRVSAVRGGNC